MLQTLALKLRDSSAPTLADAMHRYGLRSGDEDLALYSPYFGNSSESLCALDPF